MGSLRIGQSLVSVVDDTRVIVVRTSDRDVVLTCGGREMISDTDDPSETNGPSPGDVHGSLPEADRGPTALGKRYVCADESVELLCLRAGQGRLALNGLPLRMKAPKPLPVSD